MYITVNVTLILCKHNMITVTSLSKQILLLIHVYVIYKPYLYPKILENVLHNILDLQNWLNVKHAASNAKDKIMLHQFKYN